MLHDLFFALLGGALIGAAASWFWFRHAGVAGISGIVQGAVRGAGDGRLIKLSFLAGLLLAGLLLGAWVPSTTSLQAPGPLLAAGLLVGAGTRLANGCTSGHGVCGLSRFSLRSLVATVTFIAAGAVAVFVSVHLLGSGGVP